MKIVSNGALRDLVTFVELPEKEKGWFDYVEGEEQWSPRFVEYRGSWYDTNDTEGVFPVDKRWTYISESYFSGVLFRLPEDEILWGEKVVVGRYWS
jgi:hypothetical protein